MRRLVIPPEISATSSISLGTTPPEPISHQGRLSFWNCLKISLGESKPVYFSNRNSQSIRWVYFGCVALCLFPLGGSHLKAWSGKCFESLAQCKGHEGSVLKSRCPSGNQSQPGPRSISVNRPLHGVREPLPRGPSHIKGLPGCLAAASWCHTCEARSESAEHIC